MKFNEYTIADVSIVKGGKRLPKGVTLITERNTHPYIRVRDLNDCKVLKLNMNYEYVDDETQKSIARYIVSSGDIVLSIVGTIGLVAIVGESLAGANLTENCVKITQMNGVDREYLYYYLKSAIGQAEIAKGTVGAVQPKLPIKNIQAIKLALPSMVEQKKIALILKTLDDKIELNNDINEKFIKYYCQSKNYKDWVSSYNTGSTRGNINAQTYARMPVPMLPRKQQDGIVSVLESIDAKIEENDHVNENLAA